MKDHKIRTASEVLDRYAKFDEVTTYAEPGTRKNDIIEAMEEYARKKILPFQSRIRNLEARIKELEQESRKD